MKKTKQKSSLRLITRISLSLAIIFNSFALAGMVMVKDVQAEEVVSEENESQLSKEIINAGLVEDSGEETKKFLESFLEALDSGEILVTDFDMTKSPSPAEEVNVINLKVIAQNKNIFQISFDAINENLYPNSDIMYGVFLNKANEENKNLPIELLPYYGEARQIYNEELNLSSDSKINRKIEYIAPDYLSGEYSLSVELYKDSGFYLGGQRLDGTITLEGAGDFLEIISSSCRIQVGEGVEGNSYSFNGEASINPQEKSVLGICQVINHSNNQVSFTNGFKIYRGSVFNNQSQNIQNGELEFQFEPKEESLIFFPLPTDLDPQMYDVEVFLKSKTGVLSNSVIMRYFLQGASATIQNVIFDGESFSKEGNALVLLDILFYPGQSEAEKSLQCNLIIKDKNDGQICGQMSQELNPREDFEKVKDLSYLSSHLYVIGYAVPLSKNCQEPVISITAKDKNGKILAQREYQIPKKEFLKDNRRIIILTILVLLSITMLVIFISSNIKRKK